MLPALTLSQFETPFSLILTLTVALVKVMELITNFCLNIGKSSTLADISLTVTSGSRGALLLKNLTAFAEIFGEGSKSTFKSPSIEALRPVICAKRSETTLLC